MPVGNVKYTIPISGRTNAQTPGALGMRLAGVAGMKATPKPKSSAEQATARGQDAAFAKAMGLAPADYQPPTTRTTTPRGGKPMATSQSAANMGTMGSSSGAVAQGKMPAAGRARVAVGGSLGKNVKVATGKTNPFLAGTNMKASKVTTPKTTKKPPLTQGSPMKLASNKR